MDTEILKNIKNILIDLTTTFDYIEAYGIPGGPSCTLRLHLKDSKQCDEHNSSYYEQKHLTQVYPTAASEALLLHRIC